MILNSATETPSETTLSAVSSQASDASTIPYVDGDDEQWISGNERISGNKRISGDEQIIGDEQISGEEQIYSGERISDDEQIRGDEQTNAPDVYRVGWSADVTPGESDTEEVDEVDVRSLWTHTYVADHEPAPFAPVDDLVGSQSSIAETGQTLESNILPEVDMKCKKKFLS